MKNVYKLDWILSLPRSEQEAHLFGKTFRVKIKGEYFVGSFGYATKIHPEITFTPVPWNPAGHQLRTSYGWEHIEEITHEE